MFLSNLGKDVISSDVVERLEAHRKTFPTKEVWYHKMDTYNVWYCDTDKVDEWFMEFDRLMEEMKKE